jgi:hypothetical protein
MDQYLLFVLILWPDSIRASSNMAYLGLLDTKFPAPTGTARPLPAWGAVAPSTKVSGDGACDFLAIDT